jgi:hypothetical protein
MAGSGVARFSSLRLAPLSAWPVASALMAEGYSAAAAEKAGLYTFMSTCPLWTCSPVVTLATLSTKPSKRNVTTEMRRSSS